ncbi:MAG: xanthine dehydrogenase family protein molybdopterin-binding subunit [Anaerolineaceae bacterium]|nr:xanthine dehydrogenase family protein molybdopterin-binding subunit [Anaerolineaceae bacterium]
MSYIGDSRIRIDAAAKVDGTAKYPGDFNFDNQLYMKILFSERPHAIVKSIDTRAAEAVEGVVAIYTAKDVPVNEYGQIFQDQPVLCGPGSGKAYADRVRFVGDQVALVVAESEKIAAIARDKIIVEYQDLPVVTDVHKAMAPGSTLVHQEAPSNIMQHYKIRLGDIDAAFAKADVIIEGDYHTPAQEHAFLQPEAGVSYIDEEGRVTVIVAGQWVHEEQGEIAHALNIPVEQVRVIYPAIGGAFGGREDMSVQIVLALAAWRLHQKGINRPVKIIWSREESIVGHCKRHPYHIKARWGATKEGKIIAAEVSLYADAGSYAYTSTTVLGNAVVSCTAPYDIPNVKVDGYAIFTNTIPNAAFRGFGGPQGAFAAESQINKLAEALGMDPVELRMRNVMHEGSKINTGTVLPAGVSMPEVVEACAKAAGWVKQTGGWALPKESELPKAGKPYLKRGKGFACALKNVGFSFGFPEECSATIELHGGAEIEKAVLHHAGADVGQGAHTVLLQMAAEATGLPMEKIKVLYSDTATSDNSGSASASRMTFMAGNSIIGAAEAAMEKWKNEERPAIGTYTYLPPRTTPFHPETGHSFPNFTYGYVAEGIDLEVDMDTGQIKLLNAICAVDVGKAINPQQLVGQIEGCVVQVMGHALMEDLIQKDGQVLTKKLSTYLIPTVLDIPDKMESVVLEIPDPLGPWGARGMSEMPFLPFAAAVTHALHDATGVWIDSYPLTPERVLRGLGKI